MSEWHLLEERCVSETVRVELVPLGVSLEVRRGAALGSVLAAHGLEFPCGGF